MTLRAETASGLYYSFYSFGFDLLTKYATDFRCFFLQLVGLPALMIAAKLGCYPQTRCRRNEFCHFRTFAVRSGRCFVMLSFHSFDLLYSTGLVAWRKVMAAPTAGFMTHITCRLTAKNRDRLRNPTLGNRVWATFTLP